MTKPSAKIIADSVSPKGDRLTTMEVVIHRFVLAEFNTHRVFSRNSASSRAIPVHKQLERVRNDPAFPLSWPAEQPCMQGGEEIESVDSARYAWEVARDHAVNAVMALQAVGLHKSVTNRLLEPFMWHTIVVTSTEWENFFGLRCNPLAQPEIQAAAYAMRDALEASTPQFVSYGGWHLPYIQDDELGHLGIEEIRKISAARCARVSYLTQDGVRDPKKDLDLYERLTRSTPPHSSPLEHVATPCPSSGEDLIWHDGNFIGWDQLRHDVWEG